MLFFATLFGSIATALLETRTNSVGLAFGAYVTEIASVKLPLALPAFHFISFRAWQSRDITKTDFLFLQYMLL
ncbi:hypothetical protein MTP99_016912 [Tenebrio molitor]|nr:hypothetical protein MTP99_016912 [Tenebrio molitor]